MNELSPTSLETVKIIKGLQKNKSESITIDAKETLNLKETGDCAIFIRHIAAFANNGLVCHLLIGIEDKSWVSKGIPEGSSLHKVDETKQQMNQILKNKTDPLIQINYQVHNIEGKAIGVVSLKGTNPPYIISTPDSRYGGARTKGEDGYIYKGVIYTRNGTESVPISRQNELLEILNGKRDLVGIGSSLFLIGLLIAVGIGLGASLDFKDQILPAILGGIFGVLIGWILNKRLADSFGKFPIGWLGQVIKNFGGLIWGGIIGAVEGYTLFDLILSGKVQPYHPVLMGLFFTPLMAILLMIAIVPYLFAIPVAFSAIRKGK